METWLIIIILIFLTVLLKVFHTLLKSYSNRLLDLFCDTHIQNLPPGPTTFPIVGSLLWLLKPFSEIEPILRDLHAKFGPVVTLRIGSRPAVFIADRKLAYKALVQNGAIFGDRPPPLATNKVISSNQHNISSASYGPTWRLLRENLTAEIVHPSRVKSYKHAHKWVLYILLDSLRKDSSNGGNPVRVVDHFQYAMFCLLVHMSFGVKVDQVHIKEIEQVQRNLLLGFGKFNILNFWPKVTKIPLRKKWEQFLKLRRDQEKVLIPLISARKQLKETRSMNSDNQQDDGVLSYVDTLLDLNLPEEKRKLNDDEIVSLCSEFLNAGTDTTSTALQWIMANLVKYPEVQEKLYMEIKGVAAVKGGEVEEEDLQTMSYLKAVVLEGLRRHPPGHFVLPHSVSEDIELDGYLIPKKGTVNFMLADMGWDPEVWEDPMSFKPERFMKGSGGGAEIEFDITGREEIKMMPFGAGSRICPGQGLAMLHLEYFVANLVWCFEWKRVEGDDVDLCEKQEFTMVMKHPLKAYLCPRIR